MLKLSHISCRVDNLYEAAKKFKDMGFYIEWGASNINKANNFFVWLGEGPFLEVFTIKGYFIPGGLGLLLLYGILPTRKWWHWVRCKNKWCDFALEDYNYKNTNIKKKGKKIIIDIENTKNALVKKGFIVSKKTLHWSRRNAKNELANYSFFVFKNKNLPFIVSRYEPNQKPLPFKHPNGAYEVKYIKVNACEDDYYEMKKITKNDKKIIVEKGKQTHIREIGVGGLKKELNFCGTLIKGLN